MTISKSSSTVVYIFRWTAISRSLSHCIFVGTPLDCDSSNELYNVGRYLGSVRYSRSVCEILRRISRWESKFDLRVCGDKKPTWNFNARFWFDGRWPSLIFPVLAADEICCGCFVWLLPWCCTIQAVNSQQYLVILSQNCRTGRDEPSIQRPLGLSHLSRQSQRTLWLQPPVLYQFTCL